MFRKHNLVIITLGLVLLLGCVRTAAPISMEPTVGFSLSQTPAPVQTATPAVPTATPVLTLAATDDSGVANLTIQCLEIQSTLPTETTYNGVLILDGGGDFDLPTTVIDMKTLQSTLVSDTDQEFHGFSISPDHHWFSYNQFIRADPPIENLVISDATGKDWLKIPREEYWTWASWLDNDHLMVNIMEGSWTAGVNDLEEIAFRFLVLNPFTLERTLLEPDFPEIYMHWLIGGMMVVYDQSLERAVYLQGSEGSQIYYTLWDVTNAQALVSIPYRGSPDRIPKWSPLGNEFVIAYQPVDLSWLSYEIYTVERNGEITQQTNLNNYYNWVSITDYSWSPDGNKIAFWYSAGLESYDSLDIFHFFKEQQLAVLDLASGQITCYCITGDYSTIPGEVSMTVPSPLWSPDGKQLVVVNRYDEDNHNRVILVDLETELAYQIAENAIPVGWLLANP